MNASQHLFLTGFRGTGKSTVGRILGRELGRRSLDLDQLIEERATKSIREIFELGGEPLFRELESEALQKAVEYPASVISLGGGTILRESNRELLRRSGTCFWLEADAETLVRRLKEDAVTPERRPALTNLPEFDEIRELLRRRDPLYATSADYRIKTEEKHPEEVAAEILAFWRSIPDTAPE